MIRPWVIILNSNSTETKFAFVFLNGQTLINPQPLSIRPCNDMAGNGIRNEILKVRNERRNKCVKLIYVKSGK
jgi:hypothetical protein